MATLREVLREAWERQFPPGTRPPWAGNLHPSHIYKWIMRAVAAYPQLEPDELDLLDGTTLVTSYRLEIPEMSTKLGAADIARIKARFDSAAGWEIVARLGGIASDLARKVHQDFTELDPDRRPPVTPQRVSEWATSTVARPYRDGFGLPVARYLADEKDSYVRDEVSRAARKRALLPADEFVARYTAVYDQMWAELGVQAVRTLSPVRLGLGTCERPPMVGCANWLCGTDRSVLSRYQYYGRKTWSRNPQQVAEAAGLNISQHLSVRLLTMTADTVARTVLRRVCSPIGLSFPGHHALVQAVVSGVRQADLQGAYERRHTGPRRPIVHSLKSWGAAGAELPSTADPALQTAVQEYAESWTARSRLAQALATGVAAALLEWTVQVELGVPRRLWNELHGREVEWEVPLSRAEAAAVVPAMFQRHLIELIKQPITEEPRDSEPWEDDSGERLPGAGEPIASEAFLDPENPRLQRTLQALHGSPQEVIRELFTLMTERDQQWQDRYLDVISSAQPGSTAHPAGVAPGEYLTGEFLTTEEFRIWAANQLGDAGVGGA